MKPNEDDIVVSGISGRFPNSDNIEEFWCNLISGNELCSADDRRWPV
ncbi:fatty acid synthase-like protein, partial [Dinothrombium tinctorium]